MAVPSFLRERWRPVPSGAPFVSITGPVTGQRVRPNRVPDGGPDTRARRDPALIDGRPENRVTEGEPSVRVRTASGPPGVAAFRLNRFMMAVFGEDAAM